MIVGCRASETGLKCGHGKTSMNTSGKVEPGQKMMFPLGCTAPKTNIEPNNGSFFK